MERKVRTNPAQSRGLESKKTSGRGEVFFLDIPLYRTYQELAAWPSRRSPVIRIWRQRLRMILCQEKEEPSPLTCRQTHSSASAPMRVWIANKRTALADKCVWRHVKGDSSSFSWQRI